MPAALVLALILVALILAAVEQAMARGRSLVCWAVIALAVAMLLPAIR